MTVRTSPVSGVIQPVATEPSAPLADPIAAVGWMVGTLLSFILLAVAARGAATELDTVNIMLFRSIIGLMIIVTSAAMMPTGWARLKTRQPKLQVLRNAIHFFGQYCWFLALTLIPLAQLFAIEFTTPIWVALLAPLFLRERMTGVRLLTALIGFAGVLLVVRPGVVPVSEGALIMLAGAVGFALSIISVKRLVRTDDPLAILFFMSLLQIPIALPFAIWTITWPSPEVFGWMVLVTLAALSAHFCMARAMRVADAVVVAPMDFLRLPLIAVVGAVLYAEPIELWVLVGGAVIMCANLTNVLVERRRNHTAVPAAV